MLKTIAQNTAFASILFAHIHAVDLRALSKSGGEDDCGFMSDMCCDLAFKCPAGTFAEGEDIYTCETCPAGTYSGEAAKTC